MPRWNLQIVLIALTEAPSEPLESATLDCRHELFTIITLKVMLRANPAVLLKLSIFNIYLMRLSYKFLLLTVIDLVIRLFLCVLSGL